MIDANPLIEFVGEIGDHQKSAFLGGAEALLFPIDWPEPFGLVMIEAMACGTPVVAFRCGSTPEVIEDGETGFLVDTLEQAVAAASRAHLLDREAIRARFDLRFSATAMARRYLDIYGDLLAKRSFAEERLDVANTARYATALIDRQTADEVWRAFDPRLTAELGLASIG